MINALSQARQKFLAKDFERGFIKYCQFKATIMENGIFESTVTIQAHHRQQDGFIHAGVMATMADHTAGYSAFTTVPETIQILTIEFKINFLKPAYGERLECKSTVIRRGRQVIIAESEIFDVRQDNKEAVAKAMVTLMAVPKKKLSGRKPASSRQQKDISEKKMISVDKKDIKRCPWVESTPLMQHYHDHEWGVPVHDDRLLFEYIILEGAQAGLNWSTILKKREAYRKAFDDFEPEHICRYTDSDIAALMSNKDIVRNRMKIASAISNARAFINIQKEYGSFDTFIWSFVEGTTIQNKWSDTDKIPSETDESKAMASALKKKGFKFVGPTICYAFMQAVGMVNDHTINCFRHKQLS